MVRDTQSERLFVGGDQFNIGKPSLKGIWIYLRADRLGDGTPQTSEWAFHIQLFTR